MEWRWAEDQLVCWASAAGVDWMVSKVEGEWNLQLLLVLLILMMLLVVVVVVVMMVVVVTVKVVLSLSLLLLLVQRAEPLVLQI